ncbi:MAG: hypothetical protein Tsb0014_15030 [Pleurocapsa sp.]
MLQKIALALIWLAFVIYAFAFAPSPSTDTVDLIINLSTGSWEGINPLVISLFNIMGVLPAVYTCLLLFDGRGQKIPAAPFIIASFGLGAFALLPYLSLRQPNPEWQGDKNLLLKILDSRGTGLVLTLSAIALLGFGLINGNWADFSQQWQGSQFIHVMSLDFCLLCLLLPVTLRDDMKRRGINQEWVFWAVSLVPLFGTLVYLCLRRSLPESTNQLNPV